ncbi:MAG: zinc-dependent metalloprotease, partial [Bdellovibrionaceae bacterium]|nr:zinc-dependent metalloprotease [Pseudobdellovibrionaceae bacterium]
LVQIPIEWKEYRAPPSGTSGFAMTEEENTSVDWEKRRYMKLDFAKTVTAATGASNYRFVDLEMDQDYIAFTIYDPFNNMRFKQAFLRDKGNRNYKAKRMFKDDFEKFGFFTTQKHEILNYQQYKQEDYGTKEFINRYNVNNGEIVFHFTEGSDEKLIPYAAKAAEEWSEAFKKAGVPLKITANTTERVRLGDLRYNQINLFSSAEGSNLLGYGPSTSDSRTGEIISATTNMHITSIVAQITSHIRKYLLFKAGVTSTMSVFMQPPTPAAGGPIAKGDQIMVDAGDTGNYIFKKLPVLSGGNRLEMKPVELVEKYKKTKSRLSKNFGREFDISITGKNFNHEIDLACPELNSVVDAIKNGGRAENENNIVIACAEKLVPGKMMGTLLHEMGHNFGLRHNFYGSVDAMNFLPKEVTGTDEQVRSSSVMEYPSFGEDRLTKVGLYDIAAIRFGYADAVEMQSGNVVALDPKKPIAENLNGNGLKKFFFCTDEDVSVGIDPMCARHDAGTTPEEIVNHIIAQYNASIPDLSNRLGRGREWMDPAYVTNIRIQRYWIPLKKIYDEWRYKLSDQLGTGNEFLEGFDADKLEKAIAEKTKDCDMQKDPSSDACRFDQYHKAANKIFQFTMQIATLPPKYCIGDRMGKIASVEFADVRRIIMAVNKVVPSSCLDENVKNYIKEKFSFEPTSESGYELEDVRLNMKIKMSKTKTDWYGNPLPESPDIIGLMPEKMIAVQILAVRTPLTMGAADKQFLPNLLDEPKFREATLSYVADRLSKGIPQKKVTALNKSIKLPEDFFFEKFKYEKKFIDTMVSSIFYGLDVPDKAMATKQRKKKFLVKYTDKKDILDKAKYKVAGLDGTTYYAIMSEEGSEAKKLMQMLETLPKRMEEASPLDANTFVGLNDISKSFLASDDQSVDGSGFFQFFLQVIDDEMAQGSGLSRTEDQKSIDKYRVHWKKIFKKEVSSVREVITAMKNAKRTEFDLSKDLPMMMDEFKRLDPKASKPAKKGEIQGGILDKAAEFVFDSNYKLNQKTVQERIDAYRKEAEARPKSELGEDFFNYEELATQVDMIINVLRTMTEY